MFQVIRQSLVEITFVWGPLVNGGIRMGSDPNDPRKAVQNKNCVRMGVRIDPCE